MAFAEMGNIERAWELMALINPINHSLDSTAAERYKVEPYVATADIYAVARTLGEEDGVGIPARRAGCIG